MCFRITVFICFAVSSTLAFALDPIDSGFRDDKQSAIPKMYDADRGSSKDTVVGLDKSDRSPDPNELFLAGEDTPVWIAYYTDPIWKTVHHYEKLEKGFVKKAIDYWRSNGFYEFFNDKRNRPGDFLSGIRWSFDQTNGTVYRPSVLAIMEDGKYWPLSESFQREFIMKRIIYALAYWNAVDSQLRAMENPWISLQLAGIVIPRHIDDTHHVFEMEGDLEYLHLEGTLYRFGEYWVNRMQRDFDFQPGTFNIVALMTDFATKPGSERAVGSMFSNGLLCDHDNPYATGVLVTSDNMDFSELQQVVGKVAHMLGHGSDENPACTYRSDWNSREWNKCDLDSIRKSLLSNGWCMKGLTSVHDPGKPVETILPGAMIPVDEQCRNDDQDGAKIHSCAGSTCEALLCPAGLFKFCYPSNAALDGTNCGEGMICMNARCINKMSLSRS